MAMVKLLGKEVNNLKEIFSSENDKVWAHWNLLMGQNMLLNIIKIKYKAIAKLKRMALCISMEPFMRGNLMEKALFIMTTRLNMKAISSMVNCMMNKWESLVLLENFVLEIGIKENKSVI